MNRGFFADKYGWDKFSYFLLIAGLILLITSRTGFIFAIPLAGYAVWRAVSRNFQARRKEAMVFNRYMYRINYYMDSFTRKIRGLFKRNNDKTHVIVSCPRCGQKLRLPRGKGKVIITCSKCSNVFKHKS